MERDGLSLPPDKAELAKDIPNQISMLEVELEELIKRYNEIKSRMESNDLGLIVAKGTVYKGVKVVISNISYYVHDSISECQFVKQGKEIKVYST